MAMRPAIMPFAQKPAPKSTRVSRVRPRSAREGWSRWSLSNRNLSGGFAPLPSGFGSAEGDGAGLGRGAGPSGARGSGSSGVVEPRSA